MSFIRYLLVLFGLLLFLPAMHADEFVVISFKHRPEVTAAREKVMTDVNDRKCALIIVYTDINLSDAMFDANPMVCGNHKEAPGEWWVYVAPGSTKLQIKKEGFIPLNFFIPTGISLQSLNTYELRITNKEKNLLPQKEKMPEFIKIRTSPEEAKVFLNNEYKGLTPFDIPVPEGQYNWRVEKERYYTEEGLINVIAGNTQDIKLTLKPKYGNIIVNSQPEQDADIYLDGVKMNIKTPDTLKEAATGNHKVEVMKEMFEPASLNVIVSDGQNSEINLKMKPVFGEMSITTKPDAEIYIDKVKIATGSINDKRVVNGTHLIEAKKEKYNDVSKTILIKTGAKETILLELKPRTGTLSVTTKPTDAELSINGELKGRTSLFVRDLLIGEYELCIRKEGYETICKKISITENQTTEVNEKLNTKAYDNMSNKSILDNKSTVKKNSFTDARDGKVYSTVSIGTQTWFAENLSYTANNNYQKQISDNTQWANNKKLDGWCYYNNDSIANSKYGVLYQWEAAKKACPSGWHLPEDNEWKMLELFLGMNNDNIHETGWRGNEHGLKLKSVTGWNNVNNGTDILGFCALPAGYRFDNGTYSNVGFYASWWAFTQFDITNAWYRGMMFNFKNIYRNNGNKKHGFSVRCVRDSN